MVVEEEDLQKPLEKIVRDFPQQWGIEPQREGHYWKVTKDLLTHNDAKGIFMYFSLLESFPAFRDEELTGQRGFYSEFTTKIASEGQEGHPYVIGSEQLLRHSKEQKD